VSIRGKFEHFPKKRGICQLTNHTYDLSMSTFSNNLVTALIIS
jgi:hypothetical protein